jgi:hypothetical protein
LPEAIEAEERWRRGGSDHPALRAPLLLRRGIKKKRTFSGSLFFNQKHYK